MNSLIATMLRFQALAFVFLGMSWAFSQEIDPESILLKNYRPKSIYQVPTTRVEKARYPAIDMHSHPYAKSEEQVDRWIEIMDSKGIETTMIMTYTYGEAFLEIKKRFSKYPDRFRFWCGFDFNGYDQPGFGPAAVQSLVEAHQAGAIGVGELGDKGKGLFYGPVKAWGLHIDDPRMDPLLKKCAELNMPVSIHVAEPMWMYEKMDETNDGLMNAYKWRLDNQEGILGHADMVRTLENAVGKHPETKFIACHLANCSYDLSILGRMFDAYPNLYADIGARFAEFAPTPRSTARFFEKYADRIVYGTDMNFNPSMYEVTFRILESEDDHFYAWNQFSYHWPLYGLGLSDTTLKKIYRDTALSILE